MARLRRSMRCMVDPFHGFPAHLGRARAKQDVSGPRLRAINAPLALQAARRRRRRSMAGRGVL
eukprot:747493-Hanusia_phi.AAC.3